MYSVGDHVNKNNARQRWQTKKHGTAMRNVYVGRTGFCGQRQAYIYGPKENVAHRSTSHYSLKNSVKRCPLHHRSRTKPVITKMLATQRLLVIQTKIEEYVPDTNTGDPYHNFVSSVAKHEKVVVNFT